MLQPSRATARGGISRRLERRHAPFQCCQLRQLLGRQLASCPAPLKLRHSRPRRPKLRSHGDRVVVRVEEGKVPLKRLQLRRLLGRQLARRPPSLQLRHTCPSRVDLS
jgi:hypothetical protein